MWLALLTYLKPYRSEWDNFIAITLGAQLVLTINSGMALKLYEQRLKDPTLISAEENNKYAQLGFSIVLIAVTVICILLSIISTIVSIPILRKCAQKKCCKLLKKCFYINKFNTLRINNNFIIYSKKEKESKKATKCFTCERSKN